MTKKTQLALAAVLVLIFCLAFTTVTFASTGTKSEKITYRNIGIVVNGVEIAPCDVKGNPTEPFIRNSDGSTYLPVRAVADALGLSVEWKEKTNFILLKNGKIPKTYSSPEKTSKTVTANLSFRDIRVRVDGYTITLLNEKGDAVEPFIMGGSTYIPVRAVAKALGCQVEWDENNNQIIITKKDLDPPYVQYRVDSVNISNESITLRPHTSTRLSATASPSDAMDPEIYWVSSNNKVATVNMLGYVYAESEGFAYITAYTANGKSASCAVTVKDDTVVTISRDSLSLTPGGTYKLTAESKPSGDRIYWTSSKPEVATVDGSGNVTAKSGGFTYITAYTSNGKSASCGVTVNDSTTMTISKTAISMTAGGTYKLTAGTKPAGQQIYWKSSNTGVATVDGSGNVTAKGAGTAYITAYTAAGKSISCTVTVKNPAPVVTKYYPGNFVGKTFADVKAVYGSGYTVDYYEIDYAKQKITFLYDAFGPNDSYRQLTNSSRIIGLRLGANVELYQGVSSSLTYSQVVSAFGTNGKLKNENLFYRGGARVLEFTYNGLTYSYVWDESQNIYSSKSIIVWINYNVDTSMF